MPIKKGDGRKSGFLLAPITLSEPVRTTDGFTNLVDSPRVVGAEAAKGQRAEAQPNKDAEADPKQNTQQKVSAEAQTVQAKGLDSCEGEVNKAAKEYALRDGESEKLAENKILTEAELLRILEADSLNEIYELTDVLRSSSLKLYAALVRLADSRGRARVKNHELMSKAGIKGIATLYKQERWLMDLKLLEKKAKPGPHDGSSYVVHKLEVLPLPAEIYEKFNEYLSGLK